MMLSFRTMYVGGGSGLYGFRLGTDSFVARPGDDFVVERGDPIGADAVFVAAGAPALAGYVYGGAPLAALEAEGALQVIGDRTAAERFRLLFPLPPKLAA